MSDERLRRLERLAAAGDYAAAAALDRQRQRVRAGPPVERWTINLRNSILGLLVTGARRGRGRLLVGQAVPGRVTDVIEAFPSQGRGPHRVVQNEAIRDMLMRRAPVPSEWLVGLPRIVRLLNARNDTDETGFWRRTYGVEVEVEPAPRGRQPRARTSPVLDFEEAAYLGDGTDGVYFSAVRDGTTTRWWALAVVDSDTGGFVEPLRPTYGYRSQRAALRAAHDAAIGWLIENHVHYEGEHDGE